MSIFSFAMSLLSMHLVLHGVGFIRSPLSWARWGSTSPWAYFGARCEFPWVLCSRRVCLPGSLPGLYFLPAGGIFGDFWRCGFLVVTTQVVIYVSVLWSYQAGAAIMVFKRKSILRQLVYWSRCYARDLIAIKDKNKSHAGTQIQNLSMGRILMKAGTNF